MIEPWLNSEEVAAVLQVPLATLDTWAYRGTGPPFYKFGRHRRYRETDIEAWAEAQKRQGTPVSRPAPLRISR